MAVPADQPQRLAGLFWAPVSIARADGAVTPTRKLASMGKMASIIHILGHHFSSLVVRARTADTRHRVIQVRSCRAGPEAPVARGGMAETRSALAATAARAATPAPEGLAVSRVDLADMVDGAVRGAGAAMPRPVKAVKDLREHPEGVGATPFPRVAMQGTEATVPTEGTLARPAFPAQADGQESLAWRDPQDHLLQASGGPARPQVPRETLMHGMVLKTVIFRQMVMLV
jgi:hypothetical protein